MPTVGTRKSTSTMGRGYANDPIQAYAESFINTAKDKEEILPKLHGYEGHVYTIDAREVSITALGKYFPNTPMLASVVKVSHVMEEERFLNEMESSFRHKFASKPEVVEGNMKALSMALEKVKCCA